MWKCLHSFTLSSRVLFVVQVTGRCKSPPQPWLLSWPPKSRILAAFRNFVSCRILTLCVRVNVNICPLTDLEFDRRWLVVVGYKGLFFNIQVFYYLIMLLIRLVVLHSLPLFHFFDHLYQSSVIRRLKLWSIRIPMINSRQVEGSKYTSVLFPWVGMSFGILFVHFNGYHSNFSDAVFYCRPSIVCVSKCANLSSCVDISINVSPYSYEFSTLLYRFYIHSSFLHQFFHGLQKIKETLYHLLLSWSYLPLNFTFLVIP